MYMLNAYGTYGWSTRIYVKRRGEKEEEEEMEEEEAEEGERR